MEKTRWSAVKVFTVAGTSAMGWGSWVSLAPQFGFTQ